MFFKKVFKTNRKPRRKKNEAPAPICQAATSTPNCSVSCAYDSPIESPIERINQSPITQWGETIAELERSLVEELQCLQGPRCNSKTCSKQRDPHDCSTLPLSAPCPASSPPPCLALPPCPIAGPSCLDDSQPRTCPKRSQYRPPSPICKSPRINDECPASSSGSTPRSLKCTDAAASNRWPCGSQPSPKLPKDCPTRTCLQETVKSCPVSRNATPCGSPKGSPRCKSTKTSPTSEPARNSCPSSPRPCLGTASPCLGSQSDQTPPKSSTLREFISKITSWSPKEPSSQASPTPGTSKVVSPCSTEQGASFSKRKRVTCCPRPPAASPCPVVPSPCPTVPSPCPAVPSPCCRVPSPCPAVPSPCPAVPSPCSRVPTPCLAPPEVPCSAGGSSRGRVRFLQRGMPANSCTRDLEELFFNKGAKQSEDSVGWDPCVTEECPTLDLSPCATTEDVATQNADCKMLQMSWSAECGASSSSASGGVCDAARAQYYHNKLLATIEILQNKEETVRVQAESLSVAEGRIAALNARAQQLRADGDKKTNEIRTLRNQLCCLGIGSRKTDFTMQTDEEVKKQKSVVKMLQNNLGVIEELYRECFYETAKQDQMIESLRQACQDVRFLEQEKAEQVGRLQNVVNSQRWSLERCQDIAAEVDSLKLEISNFLNNSNSDSGMWEREEPLAAELAEELADIAAQLRQLAVILAGDCTCGLKDENKMLKEEMQNMESQMGELQRRLCDMQAAMLRKDSDHQQCQSELHQRDQELESVRLELASALRREAEAEDCFREQLQQLEVTVGDKTAELAAAQAQVESLEQVACELRRDLDKADQVIKENARVRCEVSQLTMQVAGWRRQLEASEDRLRAVEGELGAARDHCRSVDLCYREKAAAAMALQRELEDAHARGADLCAESRRVVCAVRHWARRMRTDRGELEEKIKEQDSIICSLRQQLECAPYLPSSSLNRRTQQTGCSKCMRQGTDDGGSRVRAALCGPVPSAEACVARGSSSAQPCCSPPRRLPRRRHCGDARCGPRVLEAGVQGPLRSDASTSASSCTSPEQLHMAVSPTEQLFERVERLHDALEAGQRRWSRGQLNR